MRQELAALRRDISHDARELAVLRQLGGEGIRRRQGQARGLGQFFGLVALRRVASGVRQGADARDEGILQPGQAFGRGASLAARRSSSANAKRQSSSALAAWRSASAWSAAMAVSPQRAAGSASRMARPRAQSSEARPKLQALRCAAAERQSAAKARWSAAWREIRACQARSSAKRASQPGGNARAKAMADSVRCGSYRHWAGSGSGWAALRALRETGELRGVARSASPRVACAAVSKRFWYWGFSRAASARESSSFA